MQPVFYMKVALSETARIATCGISFPASCPLCSIPTAAMPDGEQHMPVFCRPTLYPASLFPDAGQRGARLLLSQRWQREESTSWEGCSPAPQLFTSLFTEMERGGRRGMLRMLRGTDYQSSWWLMRYHIPLSSVTPIQYKWYLLKLIHCWFSSSFQYSTLLGSLPNSTD